MGVGGGGRRHGDQEGREGEEILMILSNVPLFDETRNHLIDSPPEVVSGGTRGLTTKRM